MNILIWSQYFWPENFHINEVATALEKRGHRVTVLTGKPNYPDGSLYPGYRVRGCQRDLYRNVQIRRIPLLPRGRGAFRLLLNYLSFIFSGVVYGNSILKGEDFDVVFVYAPSPLLQAIPAIYFAKRANLPLILWVQDIWPDVLSETGFIKNNFLLDFINLIVRFIYKYSDVILVQSYSAVDYLKKSVTDKDKIQYFPNSIDEHDFDHLGSKAANALADEMRASFAVTFTGNLGRAQSLDTILDAAAELTSVKDIKFYIVGAGRQVDWVTGEISQRGLHNVILTGRYPKEDMKVITQASSILLLTLGSGIVGSYTVPSKLQTYLAMGRPIVASADGAAAQVVLDSGAGVVCEAGNGKKMAASIMEVRSLSSLERKKMGENGIQFFKQHFSLHKLMSTLVEIFETSKRNFESSKK